MKTYQELISNPPILEITTKPREVIFKTVSCMCDNIGYIKFKKNEIGDFKMSGNGSSLKNWQFKFEPHEIEWEGDSGRWSNVISMINTGTAAIESVISR